MEGTAKRRVPAGTQAIFGQISLALLLVLLSIVLFGSGALLAPLVGEAAGAQDYLHEFLHDGRHLLGVPGH